MPFFNRKSPRIPNYDYSQSNYYFITICTHAHQCIFGNPGKLNRAGMIAEDEIQGISSHYEAVSIEKYVVMPNHIHMILIIGDCESKPNLNQIIAQYKSGVSRKIRELLPNIEI